MLSLGWRFMSGRGQSLGWERAPEYERNRSDRRNIHLWGHALAHAHTRARMTVCDPRRFVAISASQCHRTLTWPVSIKAEHDMRGEGRLKIIIIWGVRILVLLLHKGNNGNVVFLQGRHCTATLENLGLRALLKGTATDIYMFYLFLCSPCRLQYSNQQPFVYWPNAPTSSKRGESEREISEGGIMKNQTKRAANRGGVPSVGAAVLSQTMQSATLHWSHTDITPRQQHE
jgi:hypothetical protein